MRKGFLIAAYCLLVLVGLPLVYLGIRGTFSAIIGVLVAFSYVAVILFLVRYQMRAFPPSEQHHFSFAISIRFRYLLKTVLCFVAAFFWAVIVGSITSDTPIGNALAAGPALVIVVVGVYFFARAFPNPFQQQ